MDNQSNEAQFSLHASEESSSFRSKTNDIFGSLGSIEQKYETDLTKRKADDKKRSHDAEEIDDEGDFKKPNCPSLQSRERRSVVFPREKRPDNDTSSKDEHRDDYRSSGRSSYDARHLERETVSRQPRGGRFRTPDHKLNPNRWTEYSLEETCMYGDTYNRNVAMDFISELKQRKNDQKMSSGSEESLDECQKLKFHKPTDIQSSESNDDISGKSKNYGSVYKMSEYVVGMAKRPKVKHHTTVSRPSDESSCSKSSLPLDHLAEEDTTVTTTDQLGTGTDSKQVPHSQPAADAKKDNPVNSTSDEQMSNTMKADEQTGLDEEKSPLKFGKGKGKRNIRARHIDDD